MVGKQCNSARHPHVLSFGLRRVDGDPPGTFEFANDLDKTYSVDPDAHAQISRIGSSIAQFKAYSVHPTRDCNPSPRRRRHMRTAGWYNACILSDCLASAESRQSTSIPHEPHQGLPGVSNSLSLSGEVG